MSDGTHQKVVHDINAAISALVSAMELTKDEWQTNPELVDRILPLSLEKIIELQTHLARYKSLKLS